MPADRSKHINHPLPPNPASFTHDTYDTYDTHDTHMQPHERVQRVKPCRTLFVRNIAYEADSALIRTPFESYGELADFFDLIKKRGMCFITYYDLRASETAFNAMQGSQIEGRPLDVHYSLPQGDETSQPCDRGKHQGTLSVWVESCSEPINDTTLSAEFEQYGEIKEIRAYEDRSDSRFVEFFDERSAVAAYDGLNKKSWQDGTLNLYFEWDCPMVSAPKKSGGYANNMGAEQFLNESPKDFSAAALSESGGKSVGRRSRRGGQRRSKQRRGDSISEGPGAPGGYGQSSNESNVRNAYSNRHSNRQPQPYGGYLPSAPTNAPPAPYNAYGTQGHDTSRLADAQRVQALLSSLNPSTLNMNTGAGMGVGIGGGMQVPTSAPAPPIMPTPPPLMQPVQPPYYASQSPPLGLQPHAPQPPQQPHSSLPPNIMSILQAASSNVSGGGVSGYSPAPAPVTGMGYQSAPAAAPPLQQPMYNGYQTMQSVPSVPSVPALGRDPRVQQQQRQQQAPPPPQQPPSDAPPNPQSVQALLSMLNSQ